MRLRQVLTSILVLSVCAQGGCSFLLVEGPPARGEIPFRRMDGSFCTESAGAPLVDTIGTGVVPVVGLMSLYSLGGNDTSGTERMVKLSTALVLAGVEAASAIWGYGTVLRCRRYTARMR